jgi:NAD(P)-dependent dehydrogenase (short-subunit alcohol dehydrogenase family)
MGKLDNRVAIITGAASGFGRAAALLFAKEGAKVVVADYAAEAGKEVVGKIEDNGGEAIFVKADISKREDIKRMVKAAIDNYGRLDILFNNAGVCGKAVPLTEVTEEQWDTGINTNLKGAWLGMKYAIPEMLKSGGGTIINTASTAGIQAMPDVPVEYNVSKSGMIMLTKTAAAEFATENIRVNCICPAHCVTPMVEKALAGNEAAVEEFSQRQPIGRMGTAEEVAQAVLFLAARECSSFITGIALPVDGGYTAVGRGNLILSSTDNKI